MDTPTLTTSLSTSPGAPDDDSRPDRLFHDRVLVWILTIAVAACCFLISAGEGMEAGSRPWKPSSLLRPITEVMTLFHQYPTRRGTEIKWLVQALAPAALLAAVSLIWFTRTRPEDEPGEPVPEVRSTGFALRKLSTLSPVTAAQIALLLLSLWAIASAMWAPWPAAAAGEGIRHLLLVIWAIVIGRSFPRRSARNAAWAVAGVLALAGAVGIWYHLERNPQERLKFPIGNPIFLAACLLPGITLAMAGIISAVANRTHTHAPRRVVTDRWQIRVLAAVVALGLLLGAFYLTDSRGPQVGLIAGVLVGAWFAVGGRLRYAVLIAGVLALVLASLWFRSQLTVQDRGRGATMQLRFYAWQYAFTLFLERPDIGRGQASYILRAQELSRADAERDPVPFPGEMFGRAHNEWLEILAELGAVGFALCATGIGLTFWAAAGALRRISESRDRWCLIGLLAGLGALLVEECFDVALRMPGLPLVFYTVIGLIWALSREPSPEGRRATGLLARGARYVILFAGLAASGGIVAIAVRDWKGALASYATFDDAEHRNWEQAMAHVDVASRYRLVAEDYISAEDTRVRVGKAAAADTVRQLRQMIQRAREPGSDPAPIPRLAQEDAQNFDRYFRICVSAGNNLWNRIPAYPFISAFVAEAWLLRDDLQTVLTGIGIRHGTEGEPANLEQARQWMLREYLRDRLDAEIGLRLLRLSPDQPIMDRINYLRIPLRGGGLHPQFEVALSSLMADPALGPAMNQLMTLAQLVSGIPNPQQWPDAFAPETLRLAAVGYKLNGGFEASAELAEEAARLSEALKNRFPSLPSHARNEHAEYLLLASPDDPGPAMQEARTALSLCPAGDRDLRLILQRSLAVYQLAAGDEEGATETLRALAAPDSVARNVGYALAELSRTFMDFPPEARPKRFEAWISRSLELVPDWPPALLVAARAKLQQGRGPDAVAHLQAIEASIKDPAQLAVMVRALLARFPGDAALAQFAASRNIPMPTTGPASTEPESASAPEDDEAVPAWGPRIDALPQP